MSEQRDATGESLDPKMNGKGAGINPKPWRVTFNGTVSTVIDAAGGCVLWSRVEDTLNAPAPSETACKAVSGCRGSGEYAEQIFTCEECGDVTESMQCPRGRAKALQPAAWLYSCFRPGKREVFASVDENDSTHWPLDQWKEVKKEPLFLSALSATPCSDDTARMDWLDCQGMIGISHESYGDYRYYAGNGFPPIREVIDKQMAKEKK